MSLYWLSFADDSGNLGAGIVVATSFKEAVAESHRQKLNPGGEVKLMLLPGATEDNISPYRINRLYSREEVHAMDGAEDF